MDVICPVEKVKDKTTIYIGIGCPSRLRKETWKYQVVKERQKNQGYILLIGKFSGNFDSSRPSVLLKSTSYYNQGLPIPKSSY